VKQACPQRAPKSFYSLAVVKQDKAAQRIRKVTWIE
jgi:hypothetical protein